MLIQQKLENQENLSGNEKIVANYILKNKNTIKQLSITDISKDTFTSPSTTVRLTQKLGYKGYRDFKEALIEEIQYLQSHFNEIDPNIPFKENHTIQDITHIIAKMLSDTIYDTAQLIHHDSLQKTVLTLKDAESIYIFAITNTASIAYDFVYKMKYLCKKIFIIDNPEDFIFTIKSMTNKDCAIFISYSGETFEIFHLKQLLIKRKFKAISITSLGDNSLISLTDYHLYISTREKLSSKIGHFISNESIHYILDVIYASLFSLDYNQNLQIKLNLAKDIDFERSSNVSILQEKNIHD